MSKKGDLEVSVTSQEEKKQLDEIVKTYAQGQAPVK